MAADPAALQLRLLQTVVEVAAEKNSTLVMPFPVELLRFFERMTPATPGPDEQPREHVEPADKGDAEVAAAEAAIGHSGELDQTPGVAQTPEIDQTTVPPVPEIGAAPAAKKAGGRAAAKAPASDR